MSKKIYRIQIVSVPAGEAPAWVRQHWVGLTFPLSHGTSKPARVLTTGVMTGPRNFLSRLVALLRLRYSRHTGFIVDSRIALQILEANSAEAAAWWKENLPHLLQSGRYLVFDRESAKVID